MKHVDKHKANPLSFDDLKTIFTKSLLNAKDLYIDACILLDNSRYPRAHFLFRIACEEVGKSCIALITILEYINGKDIDWVSFQKNMRAHKIKTEFAERTRFFLQNGLNGVDIRYELDRISKSIQVLEDFKLQSLYAEYFEGIFCSPAELFTNDVLKMVKVAVDEMFKCFEPFSDIDRFIAFSKDSITKN